MPFNGDYAALGRMLTPSITADDARESVTLLLELGFVRPDRSGRLCPAEALLSTGYAARGLALNNFVLDTLRLAMEALDRFPKEERNLSCLTLGMSAKGFGQAEEELRGFRRRLLQIAEQDKADRVYQFSSQLFPLSAAHSPGRQVRR